MKTLSYILKPALFIVALVGFFAVSNGAYADSSTNAGMVYGTGSSNTTAVTGLGDNANAGNAVLNQVYNLIKFAYVFFYAIAVLLVAQAWMQFKQQKYDVMFASMGAALGLFLTPALIDFIHGLGSATKG